MKAKPIHRRTPEGRATGATVEDVARQAGVSTATVSRVLSGSRNVREPLREQVLEAVRALGYRPNRAARDLRVGCSRSVGVLVPDIENPFFTSVVSGIEEALQASGFSLLLANFDERPDRETTHLLALRAEGVAGLIFASSRVPSPEYAAMAAAGIPLVAVSRSPGKVRTDQVRVANAEGARTAVAHLASLGHRRIGLVNGPLALNTAREREEGYKRALRDAGIAVKPELVVRDEFRHAGGHRAMGQLLALPSPPTAVFTASNLLTLGALQAVHEREIDVPGRLAVVGFDDMAWATSLRPPLTAVAQPARDVGRTAALLLLERLASPDLPRRRVVLETTLVVRASCGAGVGAARAEGSRVSSAG